MQEPHWPILTRYDQEHLARVALPLGGIGTGTVSLGGRGDLRHWEIMNRPAKNFTPRNSFFALHTRTSSGQTTTKALEGAIDEHYEGPDGSVVANAGLPRFRNSQFLAAYPFGQVLLHDRDVPVDVNIQAFNPLIPGDAERSGIPVAILRFVLTNTSEEAITASICGSIQNFIGTDGKEGKPEDNYNIFQVTEPANIQGLFLQSNGVAREAAQYGTIALTTTARTGVTHRTSWMGSGWGDALLDFWDDFSGDGRLEEHETNKVDTPTGSLCVQLELAPGETQQVTFLLTWHFPNRQTWTPDKTGDPATNRVGNYYTTQYKDAWEVATKTAPQIPQLEENTLAFVRSFCESDLPEVVKEAALYNVSTLRTQTCFRTEDGNFFGWEGCNTNEGWCHGSCTHVWNYEQATAFLFGNLSRNMRDIEFSHATNAGGLMSFRTNLPLERATAWGMAAADGQMGCLMKLYRDWQLSGDHEWLRSLWPQARKTLEFCWIPGGWDADQDGIMEGCQHNTMDVEYYGPNPQMSLWYLGALRAAEEMARSLEEHDFADTCQRLYQQGSAWLDEHLFNGEYYEQEIRPVSSAEEIAPGLRVGAGARNLSDPEYQIGSGCLVDQLVGQYMAHICGLGYLVKPEHVQKSLESIVRYNYQADLSNHFNHLRTFALNNEAAVLMCSYPSGKRPQKPFPYYNEVMTGFEYTANAHMLYEGMYEEGLRGIADTRKRYDGRRRNPFNEAECGYHYARAMASWAAILALSGFHYSAITGTISFKNPEQAAQYFWSNGYAWGTCRLEPQKDKLRVILTTLHGKLVIQRIDIQGWGIAKLPTRQEIEQGRSIIVELPKL